MIYNFPILYKKSNNSNRFWKIYIINKNKSAEIYTEYGVINGKITKSAPKIIDKAIGKKTPYMRAKQLAETRWNNKKITDNFTEAVNDSKNFVFNPMIPVDYNKFSDYIKFPAYLQPKLDGFRMYAYYNNTGLQLLSRQSKEILNISHIKKEIEKILKGDKNFILDGELISDKLNLQGIKSALSKKNGNSSSIKYYVFDLIDISNLQLQYKKRYEILKKIVNSKLIEITPTYIVNSKEDINKYYLQFVEKGEEGAMVRNMDGIYKMKATSKDLQKIKLTFADEFIIVNYHEGSGSEKGAVIWEVQCLKNPDRTFRVKPKGTREQRKDWFKNGENYIGKKIKVLFFEKDDEGCVVRIKTGEMIGGKIKKSKIYIPKIGNKVEIIVKPYKKNIKVIGIVKKVLTKKKYHSRGHKVELTNGKIGRIIKKVKK